MIVWLSACRTFEASSPATPIHIGKPRVAAIQTGDAEVDVDLDIPMCASKRADAIAIVLGVESYRDATIPPVRFARRDAETFKKYAVEVLGVPDDRNHLVARIDGEVTRADMEKLFAPGGWLAKRVQATSDVFVYFAGHGGADPSGKSPALVLYDADRDYAHQMGFPLARLYDGLSKLKSRSSTIFVDACFSGWSRNDLPAASEDRPIIVEVEAPPLASDQTLVFAASSGVQVSGAFPDKQHGLFTYFVLKGLRGDADFNGDNAITAEELANFLKQNVPLEAGRLDREQTPQLLGKDLGRVLVQY